MERNETKGAGLGAIQMRRKKKATISPPIKKKRNLPLREGTEKSRAVFLRMEINKTIKKDTRRHAKVGKRSYKQR